MTIIDCFNVVIAELKNRRRNAKDKCWKASLTCTIRIVSLMRDDIQKEIDKQ